MDEVLKVVVLGRAARNAANVKNRQPIANMYVKAPQALSEYFTDIIRDELNSKQVTFTEEVDGFVSYIFKPQLKTRRTKIRQASGCNPPAVIIFGRSGSYERTERDRCPSP